MADLGWLRHFGQRPKTPTISGAALDDQEYFSSPGKSPSRRLRPPAQVRRVSSYLSLVSDNNASSSLPHPTVGSYKTTHSDTGSFKNIPAFYEHSVNLDSASATTTAVRHKEPEVFVREADRIWHAPSLDQMIDSLQVAMMNKPSALEPLPIQYNGHVLALLEGYAKAKQELRATKQAAAEEVEEVKKVRMRELESYRVMSEDWLERQKGYLAEIKRLELLLAEHTKEGMATVALARAGSVVDRGAKARKRFEEKVKRLSRGDNKGEGDDRDDSEVAPVEAKPQGLAPERKSSIYKHIGSIPLNIDPDHDRRLSQQLETRRNRAKQKHRRPSKGTQPIEQQDATVQAQDRGAYVPTGAPPSGRHDGPPAQQREPAQPGGQTWYDETADSSSSSYSALSTSTSSSGHDVPVPKGKGADRTGEANGTASSWDAEADPLATGQILVPHHATKTMGELAIERFLATGNAGQEPAENGHTRYLKTHPAGDTTEDYFAQPGAQEGHRRTRRFSFAPGEDESLPVSPLALPSPVRPDSGESAVLVEKPTLSPDSATAAQVSSSRAPSNIPQPQPQPWSTASLSRHLAAARQLQDTVSSASLAPAAITTTAQPLASLFAPPPPGLATPGRGPATQSRPTSTGSVIYVGGGDQQPPPPPPPSSQRSRDSTSSRVTVVRRDNSGRNSSNAWRHSSRSQTPLSDSPGPPPTTAYADNATDGGGGGDGSGGGPKPPPSSSSPAPTMSPIPERERRFGNGGRGGYGYGGGASPSPSGARRGGGGGAGGAGRGIPRRHRGGSSRRGDDASAASTSTSATAPSSPASVAAATATTAAGTFAAPFPPATADAPPPTPAPRRVPSGGSSSAGGGAGAGAETGGAAGHAARIAAALAVARGLKRRESEYH